MSETCKRLWDIAGVDGLTVAKMLFNETVGYLAPFQSVETVLAGEACSVLRLCERNFRVLYAGSLPQHVTPLNYNVHVRQYSWLTTVSLPLHKLQPLIEQATVRAPHRLTHLPNHQAVPAQLDDSAFLLWRHSPKGKPTIDIHTASARAKKMTETISRL